MSRCQSPLPAASPGEVCPACLMKEALGPMDSLDDLRDSLAEEAEAADPAILRDPLEGTILGPGVRYKILQLQCIGEGVIGISICPDVEHSWQAS